MFSNKISYLSKVRLRLRYKKDVSEHLLDYMLADSQIGIVARCGRSRRRLHKTKGLGMCHARYPLRDHVRREPKLDIRRKHHSAKAKMSYSSMTRKREMDISGHRVVTQSKKKFWGQTIRSDGTADATYSQWLKVTRDS